MFSRTSSKLLCMSSLALLAVATPWGAPATTTTPVPTKTITVTASPTATSVSTCSTGDASCCASTESSSSAAGSALLGLLGIVIQGVDVLLGLDCSPITVVGVGEGGSCSGTVVCCEDNAVNNLINIGCVPIVL